MEPANNQTTPTTTSLPPQRTDSSGTESNADMNDPASIDAIAPVRQLHQEPSPQDLLARVASTHDVHGGGNPRLVLTFDDSISLKVSPQESASGADADSDPIPREFPLVAGVTTIGSDVSCDICLPGLNAHHADVERDSFDEYNIIDLSDGGTSVDGGRKANSVPLRTGRRVSLGEWTLIYQRGEHADHGNPHGGHIGGELNGHPTAQDIPRPRGTSAAGGSEPTATDPGEYY